MCDREKEGRTQGPDRLARRLEDLVELLGLLERIVEEDLSQACMSEQEGQLDSAKRATQEEEGKGGRTVGELLSDGGTLAEGGRDLDGGVGALGDAVGELQSAGTSQSQLHAVARGGGEAERGRTSSTSFSSVISSSRSLRMPLDAATPRTSSPAASSASGASLHSAGTRAASWSRFLLASSRQLSLVRCGRVVW